MHGPVSTRKHFLSNSGATRDGYVDHFAVTIRAHGHMLNLMILVVTDYWIMNRQPLILKAFVIIPEIRVPVVSKP